MMNRRSLLTAGLAGVAAACTSRTPGAKTAAADPLPSWKDGPSKRAILAFVDKVTKPGGPDFVAEAERIATLDNDGTLWSEQPIYFQIAFALDRVKALVPEHPEWRTVEPFRSILKGDLKTALAGGDKALVDLLVATHTGMTEDEFSGIVKKWLAEARHPKFQRPYTELVFQPMLELLTYLRERKFKTFIVSGGSADFMRVWVPGVYGVPPEQVVGTRFKLQYQVVNGQPVILRQPAIEFVDDKAGKPVGIENQIGRRPIFAAGNSDGDFEMLEWTTSRSGPSLGIIVHHTDGEREFAYDRASGVGRLDRVLDEAPKRGWQLVDMKQEWLTVYPASR